ncbi:MAG: peptidase M28, partial [Sediminibacterium sp.]
MYPFRKLIYAVPVILLASCSQKGSVDHEDGLAAFSADSLKSHVAVLASDSFMGRKPFTEGETKTIAYLQQQFVNAGLEPGNGSSYLQEVPMVNIKTTAAPTMQVKSAKGNFDLKAFDDYILWTDKTDAQLSLSDNELVFAGYGVVAPEYNWNDYAGIDVKGKVVMVMVNDPGWNTDSTLFKGRTMTYYGRWTYKFEEAARQGAKGCLIIHNTAAASYSFSIPQNNHNASRLQLDERGKNIEKCDMVGWIQEPVAKKLLITAGLDTNLLAKANMHGA